jgi:epoxyqueuosine reductase
MPTKTSKMPEDACIKQLSLMLARHGYQGRIVSIDHLSELKEDVEGPYMQGLFDEEFYRERLAWFDFRIPDSLPDAKSMIVVAVPRPQSQVVFTWNGERRELILPPTYVAYKETTGKVEDILAKLLKTRGYRIARTALPLKLLAVRSGLGEYGRNNICYVPGMGSFLQLVGVYSDMPSQKDSWRKPQMMRICQNCHACRLGCPTGAISSDRFLLHTERCIVFHNERRGDIPFPAWMDPSWHNCLCGCLHCQRVCPEDKNFMQWIQETEEFSEGETSLLLKGVSRDELLPPTIRKLEHLNLIEDLGCFPRNLGVFFGKSAHKS